MRVALIAPPFIPVPPVAYGGTELFIAQLAEGLVARGLDVVVYANAESSVRCEVRWLFPKGAWPPPNPEFAHLRNADHSAWAVHDAAQSADILHINDAIALPFTRFVSLPAVLTLHHPHEPGLSAMYERYPAVEYVAISQDQARREPMRRMSVAHHGLHLEDYRFSEHKEDYLAFLGRIVPCKGAHVAIDIARRSRLRLKIAGEVQPMFQQYWNEEVRPQIDGDQIQYIGQADLAMKNDLLSGARALLFPIEWDEPFGLVMIEAMACGTPVLAFPGGAVEEIVRDGVSGWICHGVDDMVARAASPGVDPRSCRDWVADQFSSERMVDAYLEVYRRARLGGD